MSIQRLPCPQVILLLRITNIWDTGWRKYTNLAPKEVISATPRSSRILHTCCMGTNTVTTRCVVLRINFQKNPVLCRCSYTTMAYSIKSVPILAIVQQFHKEHLQQLNASDKQRQRQFLLSLARTAYGKGLVGASQTLS